MRPSISLWLLLWTCKDTSRDIHAISSSTSCIVLNFLLPIAELRWRSHRCLRSFSTSCNPVIKQPYDKSHKHVRS